MLLYFLLQLPSKRNKHITGKKKNILFSIFVGVGAVEMDSACREEACQYCLLSSVSKVISDNS